MKEESEFRFDEIDLFGLAIRIIKEAWVAILGTIAVILLFTIVMKAKYQPQYTASITFAVSSTVDANNVYNNLSTTTDLAGVFEEVFKSEIMRSTVAKELGKQSLDCTISTEVIQETNLMLVHVMADNPTDAYRILQGIIHSYKEVSNHVFDNVVLQIIDSPAVPEAPSNPLELRSMQKKVGAVAFLFFIALIGSTYIFRGTVMTEAGAKRQIDGRLLGAVNKERKNKTFQTIVHKTNKNIMLSNPMTSYVFTENIHKLTTKLSFEMRKKQLKSIMFTSMAENEGKTTIAVNFAMSLASSGYRVLLVEGDLCKPALYKMFGRNPEENDNYTKKFDKDQRIPTKQENLSLLLTSTPIKNSETVLSSKGMKAMLERYKEEVDFLLIDAPPIGANMDAESIADLVDASVLVVRQDVVEIPFINDGLDQLAGRKAQVLGYVLNGVSKTTFSKSYGYGRGYGYGYGYGKKYGYGSYRGRKPRKLAEEE